MKILPKILKIFAAISVIIVMCCIFKLSSQRGMESWNLSYQVSYKIVEKQNEMNNMQMTKEEMLKRTNEIYYYVRKVAHVVEYFILTMMASLFFCGFKKVNFKTIMCTLIVCVSFAVTDEFHQIYVDGRLGTWQDVIIDSIGILCGILVVCVCWIVSKIMKRIIYKKSVKYNSHRL